MTSMTELGPAQSTLLADENDGKVEKKVKDNAKTGATIASIEVLKKTSKEKPEDAVEDPALGFGGEGYAMLTSMSFDLTENSDKYVQDLLDKITTIVIEANGNLTDKDIDKIRNVGLEDYRDLAQAAMKRILQFLRWSIAQGKEGIKRLSDRLGRLGVKTMYVERKLDVSTDSSLPTDQFVLARSFPLLMLADKPPANAMDVLNSLNKTKYLFSLLHNDYQNFQNLFKQAVATGSRSDTLNMINNYLTSLSSRLGAKPNPQFNNKLSFNYLPGGYRLVFSTGDSFADCSATLVRVPGQYNVAPTAPRPDKSSMVRLMAEIKQFLRTINEIYGKVSSRLESDFRNISRNAEKDIKNFDSAADIRTASTTVEWFVDQQSRIFTRSMMLSCSVLNACLDYCLAAIGGKPAAGMEGFDDEYTIEAVGDELEALDGRLRDIEIDARTIQSIGDIKELVDVDSDYVLQLLRDRPVKEQYDAPFGLNYSNLRNLVRDGKATDFIISRLGSIYDLTTEMERSTAYLKDLFVGREAYDYNAPEGYIADFTTDHPLCSFLHRVERETLSSVNVANYLQTNMDKLHEVTSYLMGHAESMTETVVDGELIVSRLKEFMLNTPDGLFKPYTLCGGFKLQERSESLAGLIVRGYTLDHVKDLSPIQSFDTPDPEMNGFIEQEIQRYEDGFQRLAKIVELLQVGTGHLRYVISSVADNLNAGGLKGEGDDWVYTAMEYLAVASRQYRWMYRLTIQLALYERTVIVAARQYIAGGFYGYEQ
jgi:hypothetical protein